MAQPRRDEPLLVRGPLVWMGISAAIVMSVSYCVAKCWNVPLVVVLISLGSMWLLSGWVTEAYWHKYPQRYGSYLLASRLKMAVLLTILLGIAGVVAGGVAVSKALITAGWLAIGVELLFSLPRRQIKSNNRDTASAPMEMTETLDKEFSAVDADRRQVEEALMGKGRAGVPRGVKDFILGYLGGGDVVSGVVRVLDDDRIENPQESAGLLIQTKSFNSIRRLNLFLEVLPAAVKMGGYFVFRYRPLEEELEELRCNHSGLTLPIAYAGHFIWFRALPKIPILEKAVFWKPLSFLDELHFKIAGERRRVLARAEAWGRMAYWGFEVVAEEKIGVDYWVVARRIAFPEKERKPSFFLVVALHKVGLDGEPLMLHKLRTMYPFSEFIQAKLYRDHGLSTTGKFKDDFRLTDYGKFLRKYWLDEIPQIWDWLRGDIKLVGMRATSAHFLSLYPREIYDLYIQIKPGLIPPIFDENTQGFDDIVRIEMEYLEEYREQPIMTDIRYFLRTFNDIVFRGVRSK